MSKLFKKDTKQFLNALHKLTDKLAAYILEQNDISIDGLCDNVVSYCQYDCYYDINMKGA